jgi:hypothetical protein
VVLKKKAKQESGRSVISSKKEKRKKEFWK